VPNQQPDGQLQKQHNIQTQITNNNNNNNNNNTKYSITLHVPQILTAG
jgi:hypothetical protein